MSAAPIYLRILLKLLKEHDFLPEAIGIFLKETGGGMEPTQEKK